MRRNGRYFENMLGFEGLQRDGWCEQKARFVFSPGNRGDFLIVQVAGLATSAPVLLSVTINEQKPVPFVLLNEFALLEIPIETLSIPTQITLQADRAFRVNARDKKEYSYRIEGAGLITGHTPTLTHYYGDKRDSREKQISGIYSNGLASNITRLRIDNPLAARPGHHAPPPRAHSRAGAQGPALSHSNQRLTRRMNVSSRGNTSRPICPSRVRRGISRLSFSSGTAMPTRRNRAKIAR